MPKTSLTEAFNKTVAEAEAAFPDMLKGLVVFTTGAEQPLYVSPTVAAALSVQTAAVKAALDSETKYIISRNAAGMAYRHYALGKTGGLRMIGLREKMPGDFSAEYTHDMRALYVLDHELGHHVTASGKRGGHAGECGADAFAVLRHVQRFGADTPLFERSTKAYNIVLGLSPIHYTEDVFQKVRRYVKTNDIKKLSLQETAALADEIAPYCTMPSERLWNVAAAFDANRRAYAAMGNPSDLTDKLYARDKDAYATFCRKTTAVMQQNSDDGDIIRAGKRFLNYPPLKNFIQEQAKKDPAAWQDVVAATKMRVPPYKKPVRQKADAASVFRVRGKTG